MRLTILCLASALLGATVANAAPGPSYADLLARAQQGDPALDYTALRMAYAESDDYDPYDAALRDPYEDLIASVHGRDCPAVLSKSEAVLKISFLSIFTHLFRAECLDKSGDAAGTQHELAIAHGLEASLKASGDGMSTKTAFVVVAMSEEHYLLVTLGFGEERQALLNDNGHVYDAITGHDDKGVEHTAYFDVGALFAGMQRRMDKGKGAR